MTLKGNVCKVGKFRNYPKSSKWSDFFKSPAAGNNHSQNKSTEIEQSSRPDLFSSQKKKGNLLFGSQECWEIDSRWHIPVEQDILSVQVPFIPLLHAIWKAASQQVMYINERFVQTGWDWSLASSTETISTRKLKYIYTRNTQPNRVLLCLKPIKPQGPQERKTETVIII